MKKILISLLIISWIIFTWYAAYINLVWSKLNSDAWLINNDNWNFWWNYTYTDPSGANWWLVAKLVWEIDSTLFWKFYFWTWTSTTPIEFRKFPDSNLCWAWNTVFKITWDIESFSWAWATMSFTGDSYYCPWTNSWSWTVYSDLLGYKQMWNINTVPGTLTSSWSWIWAIFNNDSLVVQWIVWKWSNNSFNIWNTVNTANGNSQQSIFVDVWVSKWWLDLLVNKNISLLTKGITPVTTNTYKIDTNVLNNKNLHYYNFEWSSGSVSNENNKWKILTIWINTYINPTNTNPPTSNYQVWATGNKTVIVKWWNIYINADIYDTTGVLVLVAKRDSTNNNNWWNIYINPDVTNIDAVMIADGSIMNYNPNITNIDWSHVVTSTWDLMKQLLIYGSIYTKNTIWWTTNPYWSDWYIKYWRNSTIWAIKYDLTKLRHFSLITSPITWGVACSSPSNYLVPRQNTTSTGTLEYAWAWKRKCFNEPLRTKQDALVNNLRWSNKFNSVIVKYNPAVKTNPPKILLK